MEVPFYETRGDRPLGADVLAAVEFDLDVLRTVISDRRTRARVTQDEVASALGCTRKWVSRFERGLSVPSFELVVAYAAFFGVGLFMEIEDDAADLGLPSKEIRKSKDLSDVSH